MADCGVVDVNTGRGCVLLLSAGPTSKRLRVVDHVGSLAGLAAVPPHVLGGTHAPVDVVSLVDPVDPQAVLTHLRTAAAAPGPLVVHLVGQLTFDRKQRRPHIALAQTTPHTVRYSALPWEWLDAELGRRHPGMTTIFADLVADGEAFAHLDPVHLVGELQVWGAIAPPRRRGAEQLPGYTRSVAGLLRGSTTRPRPAELHAAGRNGVDAGAVLLEPRREVAVVGGALTGAVPAGAVPSYAGAGPAVPAGPAPDVFVTSGVAGTAASAAPVPPVGEATPDVSVAPAAYVAPDVPLPPAVPVPAGTPVGMEKAAEVAAGGGVPGAAPAVAAPAVAAPAVEPGAAPPASAAHTSAAPASAAPVPVGAGPAASAPASAASGDVAGGTSAGAPASPPAERASAERPSAEPAPAEPAAPAGPPPASPAAPATARSTPPAAPPAVPPAPPMPPAAPPATPSAPTAPPPGGVPAATPPPPPPPAPRPGGGPVHDPREAIGQALRAHRYTEAASLAASWEQYALRTYGPASMEMVHVTEAQAQIAYECGEFARAADRWIAAAQGRLAWHAPDHPEAVSAVDNAHHVWQRLADIEAALRLAPQLVALRRKVPGASGQALRALQRRLEALESGTFPQAG
jgi:hypothetical protein